MDSSWRGPSDRGLEPLSGGLNEGKVCRLQRTEFQKRRSMYKGPEAGP